MPRVFISYRRADSAAFCGRIYDLLRQRFKRRDIFKDVDSIPPGADFPSFIEQTLTRSDVTLVVIGPRWLGSTELAASRLADPADFVRIEIETALRLGLAVLPVLVDGATMPAAEALPESLRPITRLNALVVRNDPDFHRDMQRVVSALQAIPAHKVEAAPRWMYRARDAISGPPSHGEPSHATLPTAPDEGVVGASVEPITVAAPTMASLATLTTRESPTDSSSPKQRAPARRLSRRAAAMAAVALTLVAAVALAGILHGLTIGAGASSLSAGALATQSARAAATSEARAFATWSAQGAKVTAITPGYSVAAPGCSDSHWLPAPPPSVGPACEGAASTLTGNGNPSAIITQVNKTSDSYSIQITISRLAGVAGLTLTGSDMYPYWDASAISPPLGQPHIISLERNAAGLQWTLWGINGGDIKMGSGSVATQDTYTIVVRSTSQHWTIAINGEQKFDTFCGNDNGGYLCGNMSSTPAALSAVELDLYSNGSFSVPTSADTVTFSAFSLKAS